MSNDKLKDLYSDFFDDLKKMDDLSKNGTMHDELAGKVSENAGKDPLSDFNSVLDEMRKMMNTDPLIEAVKKNPPPMSAAEVNAMGNDDKPKVQTATAVPKPEEQPQKQEEPETDPIEELNALIGLTTIKHDVKELTDFVQVQKMRKDAGLKSVPVSLHLVFTGNPGTGKTTVARIIARIYKNIGVLSKGQLVEVDRSGLVAGYVGQTALKTQEKIKEAMGGVLFIDEAYALANNADDAFGKEAIDTILKAMEDHRDDFIVVVAGYTGPMENFINSNPGLKSRFNKYIEFPDYTIDELMAIFEMNCKKYDYQMDEDVKKQVRALITLRKLTQLENFANAREVRNLFEEIITNQARRVAVLDSPTPEDMSRITLEDLMDTDEEETTVKVTETAAEAAAVEAAVDAAELLNDMDEEDEAEEADEADDAEDVEVTAEAVSTEDAGETDEAENAE